MRGVPSAFGAAVSLVIAGAVAAAVLGPVPAIAAEDQHHCTAPIELARLDQPLRRIARQLATGHPIKIVAVGSSSTAGAGASAPEMSYPARLEAELRHLFPRVQITVVNRGVNGEEARDMLARFDRDVFAEKPDLVIWQVGSNSVLRDRPLADARRLLHEGIERLRAADIDVVLMNPQYSPKVITKHDVEGMVSLIDLAVKETNVDLFQRYAVMRYWRLTEDLPFSAFVSPDELHMNDWGYGCIGKLLAGAIHEVVTRPTLTATARTQR